jgi:hypothetical protein
VLNGTQNHFRVGTSGSTLRSEDQRSTNAGHQIARMAKFCTASPYLCGASVWKVPLDAALSGKNLTTFRHRCRHLHGRNHSALKTETEPPSETSVGLYQSIRRQTTEDGILLVSYSIVYCNWVWDIECLSPQQSELLKHVLSLYQYFHVVKERKLWKRSRSFPRTIGCGKRSSSW